MSCDIAGECHGCYCFEVTFRLYFSSPHGDRIKPSHTWIGEDPRGDVGASAHDVLHIQTGLDSSLSGSLSAHNPIHLSLMLKAAAEHPHELGQVCRAVVLLQELENRGKNHQIRLPQQRKHSVLF